MVREFLTGEQARQRLARRSRILSAVRAWLAQLAPVQVGGQTLFAKADLRALAHRLKAAGGDNQAPADPQPATNESTIPTTL